MSNFFKETDIDTSQAEAIVTETLKNCDDGELYLENHKSESIVCLLYTSDAADDA